MKSFNNMPLLFKTARTTSIIIVLTTLVSCASFSGKSNDDKLAKLAGETFVLSVAKTTLNLDLVTGEKKSDQSIFRLVNDQDAKLALTSNGNRKTGALKITDTSASILNSLSVYFKKKYQEKGFLKTKVNIELVIPIVKDKNNDYRVDGRSFVEDEQELIFQGQVTFIETHKDYPKQKKKFRFKTKKRIKKSKKI